MPTGRTLNLSSRDRRPFTDAFKKLAEWNHRDGAQLFVDATRKLAYDLEAQTAAIAPSESKIAADVRAQGWKIPTLFKRAGDSIGRLGRGWPNQWTEFDIRAQRKGKRGRKTKAEKEAESAQRAAHRPTLSQMQAYVIKARTHARKYLASGWLGAILDMGGSIRGTNGDVDRERGGAIVKRSVTSVEITLWNRTPGIETMDAKKHFVDKAVAVRTADMLVYIRRKMDEAANRIFRKAA